MKSRRLMGSLVLISALATAGSVMAQEEDPEHEGAAIVPPVAAPSAKPAPPAKVESFDSFARILGLMTVRPPVDTTRLNRIVELLPPPYSKTAIYWVEDDKKDFKLNRTIACQPGATFILDSTIVPCGSVFIDNRIGGGEVIPIEELPNAGVR